jgi:hypothetical protein
VKRLYLSGFNESVNGVIVVVGIKTQTAELFFHLKDMERASRLCLLCGYDGLQPFT